MGASCSRPSTASSSTVALPPASDGVSYRYRQPLYRSDTSLRSSPTITSHRRARALRSRPFDAAAQSPPVATLDAVPGPRQIVDYALQRRVLLADVAAGRVPEADACDAGVYLLQAAAYHG